MPFFPLQIWSISEKNTARINMEKKQMDPMTAILHKDIPQQLHVSEFNSARITERILCAFIGHYEQIYHNDEIHKTFNVFF